MISRVSLWQTPTRHRTRSDITRSTCHLWSPSEFNTRTCSFLVICEQPSDSTLNSKVAMFADDTKVYKVVMSEDDGAALQQDLDNLSSWSAASGLAFNDKKCKLQTITRKRKPICTSYEVNGSTIKSCDVERDLGISLDCDLT